MRSTELGLMLAMVNIDIGGPLMVNKIRDELIKMSGKVRHHMHVDLTLFRRLRHLFHCLLHVML